MLFENIFNLFKTASIHAFFFNTSILKRCFFEKSFWTIQSNWKDIKEKYTVSQEEIIQ